VGLVLGLSLSRGPYPLACADKGRVLYNNVGGVGIGNPSLWWDWIVSTNCAGLSGSGYVACVQKVVWEDGLGCCVGILNELCIMQLPPIATWNLRFQKQHAASFIRQQGTRYARCAGALSSCWDGSWGDVLKYAPKQHLTHDFSW